MFNITLEGRLRNISLGQHRPLIPLFEAVVNSIHSIQSASNDNGAIEVEIKRDESQEVLNFESTSDTRRIVGFEIVDNGVGFDEDNFSSFKTSDSTYKPSGKGIGRFMWLKAFDKVNIDSVFESGKTKRKRSFDFLLSEQGIENLNTETSDSERRTTVKLIGFKDKYAKTCPKSIVTIAEKLIEHCLVYFLGKNCPKIIVRDAVESLSLNEIYKENVKGQSKTVSFTIKGEVFNLTSLRLYISDSKKDRAYYCANDRVVRSINLDKRIPDLNGKLKDDKDRGFKYAAYISGDFLDRKVNQERTSFNIENESDGVLPNVLAFDEIETYALSEVKKYLNQYLKPISDNKIEEITKYVKNDAPQYRATIKYNRKALDKIPPNLPKDKLDIELHKMKSEINLDLKEQTAELINKSTDEADDAANYLEKYQELIPKISEFSSDQLAEYVIHRKSIISLLDKCLNVNESGKYDLEDTIHRIIFPMRTTSDEIDYDKQNLWLIDERLSFHHFLASDKPLSKLPSVETKSTERPDIVVFNKALAYAESSAPFSSVVIIELKRPMRDDFTDESNPIIQVIGYIEKIRESKEKDVNGRPINVSENTPFYAYIICDLTASVEKHANRHDYTKTPDAMGYFNFHKNINAYVEIISFTKLVEDSKKRNQILFDKLNLPS